ncbi:MAG: hypothetical protein IJ905_00590 [Fibrobacter sp.]|nr:hypothetical protein [Fibrobacter sp.]
MKKLISLATLLFFAVVAAAQNEPSEKIEQIVSGDNVKAQSFFLEWNKDSYSMTQTVDAGKPIGGIVFDYEGMNDWNVTGLPSGLVSEIDETNHKITISGTVNKEAMSYPCTQGCDTRLLGCLSLA